MSAERRKAVRIDNPVSEDCHYTSRNRANRFVAQGRAEWIEPGVSIRFVTSDHRHRAAQKSVDLTRLGYDRAAYGGVAQFADLLHLPVVAPAVLLGFGRRKGASRHTFLASRGILKSALIESSLGKKHRY
jgi:hypothetical protein